MLYNSEVVSRKSQFDILVAKTIVTISLALLATDTIYKTYFGISYQTRDKCVLYNFLPHWAFVIYENFIELALVVVLGVFAATLLERYFFRVRRFVPHNPVLAFLYAAVLPVCSCSAVPLVTAVAHRVPFRTVVTFIVAAPLLNPYIVMLSVTVLGIKYALLRVACSLILAVSVGYIAEVFYRRQGGDVTSLPLCSSGGCCGTRQTDIFRSTLATLKKIMPYIVVAGVFGVAIELSSPGQLLKNIDLGGSLWGSLAVIAIGVPVYFCNGADVLFLNPLVQHGHLPLGTAMAFSLTSTSVCITSLILMIRYIGRKLTVVILAAVVIMTMLLSLAINALDVSGVLGL